MASFVEDSSRKSLNLRAIGFCGADDSVDPMLLQLISTKYPWVEWGVLLRPDLEGTPRYPTAAWLDALVNVNKSTGSLMRLAGHLCKQRCQEVFNTCYPIVSYSSQVLDGDHTYVKHMASLGFARFQVNATTANGVDMSLDRIPAYIQQLKAVITAVPEAEFIIQLNEETRSLWTGLSAEAPDNMSVLFDASCGKGVVATSFPPQPDNKKISCGYAGGIGPDNLASILDLVGSVSDGRPVWVDMESSLRVAITDKKVLDKDVFSVDKCFACIKVGLAFGLPSNRFSVVSI